jgi:DNA-binding response OmpR family regulator
MNPISILIIDDDEASQGALRQLLDSEGWRVSVAPLPAAALQELATGDWKLVIANVAMTGLSGPLFATLRELALSEAMEGGATRVRVLFLVPELAALEAQPVLERARLSYLLKPFHLHDFLERVSDLLMETETIATPIRRVRQGVRSRRGRGHESATGLGSTRDTNMFANREDYVMTEEEILEYERQQAEESNQKRDPGSSG